MKASLFFVCLFFVSSFAYAQTDKEGSEDHPLLTRYPESYISYYETVKFREYNLAIGSVTGYRYIEEKEKIEGQMTRITYFIDKPTENLSIGEVYRDYSLALQKAGISIVAKGSFPQSNVKKDVGGGQWIGLALGANAFPQKAAGNLLFAGTSSSGGTFAIIGKIGRAEGTTYVAIYGERHSNKKVVVHVDVIELQTADVGHVFADANYIRQEIEDRGSVAIYGITFDFNSSTIKPESKASLDEIANYLKTNSNISLYVVGHTDMMGTLSYNLQLSKDRAKAVVDALTQNYGIDSKRLISDGVAFLAPRATNKSDLGRSMNRRTELVKRIK
ncbi:MAG: OmpA family protein [Chitinophagales bacterium]